MNKTIKIEGKYQEPFDESELEKSNKRILRLIKIGWLTSLGLGGVGLFLIAVSWGNDYLGVLLGGLAVGIAIMETANYRTEVRLHKTIHELFAGWNKTIINNKDLVNQIMSFTEELEKEITKFSTEEIAREVSKMTVKKDGKVKRIIN